ncbi:hypothetical protein E2986_12817, partial [Frieseomelitta varia]
PHVRIYKVSLQFQKFITKVIEEISSSDLFYIFSNYQDFYHIAFHILLMNKILLNELLKKWLLFKRRHSVCHDLLKPTRICRLSETS